MGRKGGKMNGTEMDPQMGIVENLCDHHSVRNAPPQKAIRK